MSLISNIQDAITRAATGVVVVRDQTIDRVGPGPDYPSFDPRTGNRIVYDFRNCEIGEVNNVHIRNAADTNIGTAVNTTIDNVEGTVNINLLGEGSHVSPVLQDGAAVNVNIMAWGVDSNVEPKLTLSVGATEALHNGREYTQIEDLGTDGEGGIRYATEIDGVNYDVDETYSDGHMTERHYTFFDEAEDSNVAVTDRYDGDTVVNSREVHTTLATGVFVTYENGERVENEPKVREFNDDNGNHIVETQTSDGESVSEKRETFGADGRLVSSVDTHREFNESGDVTSRTVESRNGDGELLQVERSKFSYDGDVNSTQVDRYEDGNVVESKERQYDDYENTIYEKTVTYTYDGDIPLSTVTVETSGSTLVETTETEDGKQIDTYEGRDDTYSLTSRETVSPDGVSVKRDYDSNGHVSQITRDNPNTGEHSVEARGRDDNGNPTSYRIDYLNGERVGSERTVTRPADGQPGAYTVDRTRIDADGNQIERTETTRHWTTADTGFNDSYIDREETRVFDGNDNLSRVETVNYEEGYRGDDPDAYEISRDTVEYSNASDEGNNEVDNPESNNDIDTSNSMGESTTDETSGSQTERTETIRHWTTADTGFNDRYIDREETRVYDSNDNLIRVETVYYDEGYRGDNPEDYEISRDTVEYNDALDEGNNDIENPLDYPEFQNDKEVVLSEVTSDGRMLQYASDELKADKEVVLAAVEENGWALAFASDDLKADKEVVLAAVTFDGAPLEYASDDLKADKDVVLAAVTSDGWALEYASDDLKGDKEVALVAVNESGPALRYVSDDLKADKEVVLAAVTKQGTALEFASEELKVDKEVVLAAVKDSGAALQFASDDLKADREVAAAALESDPTAFRFLPEDLLAEYRETGNVERFDPDKAAVIEKVSGNGLELMNYPEYQNDKDVVKAAVSNIGQALQFASDDLKADREVVAAAVENNASAIYFASDDLKEEYRERDNVENTDDTDVDAGAEKDTEGADIDIPEFDEIEEGPWVDACDDAQDVEPSAVDEGNTNDDEGTVDNNGVIDDETDDRIDRGEDLDIARDTDDGSDNISERDIENSDIDESFISNTDEISDTLADMIGDYLETGDLDALDDFRNMLPEVSTDDIGDALTKVIDRMDSDKPEDYNTPSENGTLIERFSNVMEDIKSWVGDKIDVIKDKLVEAGSRIKDVAIGGIAGAVVACAVVSCGSDVTVADAAKGGIEKGEYHIEAVFDKDTGLGTGHVTVDGLDSNNGETSGKSYFTIDTSEEDGTVHVGIDGEYAEAYGEEMVPIDVGSIADAFCSACVEMESKYEAATNDLGDGVDNETDRADADTEDGNANDVDWGSGDDVG